MLGVRRLPCGFLAAQPFSTCLLQWPWKGICTVSLPAPPWACVKPGMEVPSKVQGQMSDPGVLLGNCLSNEDPCGESLLTQVERPLVTETYQYFHGAGESGSSTAFTRVSSCQETPQRLHLGSSHFSGHSGCREHTSAATRAGESSPFRLLSLWLLHLSAQLTSALLVASGSQLESAGLQVLLGWLSWVGGVVLIFLLGVVGWGF